MSDILEPWKKCPHCGEKGDMAIETADVVCTNPGCEYFQKVVR